MAFGSWIKKIGDKVKSFGEKVKNVAQTALPYVEKGTAFLRDTAGPAISQLGNTFDNDTIRNIGSGVTKFGEASNRWVNKGTKYLGNDG